MKLSEDIKAEIQSEYDSWKNIQYGANSDKKSRQSKGQFFTPPVLTIKMLEKFDTLKDKDILDPASGAGGLIAAAIIAGANPKRCYCIELDPEIAVICRIRLSKLGVPRHHVHVGNSLESSSYEFLPSKSTYSLEYDRRMKQVHVIVSERDGSVKLDKTLSMTDKSQIEFLWKLCKKLVDKEVECIKGENVLNAFGKVFVKLGLSEV